MAAHVVGTGLVLPTTATLAIVAVSSQSPAVALASSGTTSTADPDGLRVDDAELLSAKSADAAALTRAVDDRVARDSERSRVTIVTAENGARAATEAQLAAAADTPIDVAPSDTPSDTPTSDVPATGTPAPVGSKAWVKPINSYVLTSGYGWRWGRIHAAQDFAVSVGTPVKSMSSGVVVAAGWMGTYGNRVEIKYWDGTVSLYAHNSALKVKVGDKVAPGQIVALSGNTGNSTGPHLHVEIRTNGNSTKIAPLPWMRAKGLSV
ncbi:MAG TPA: M23 family metallopeptidase [Dermatophilaceae bacterium]|nr:M23 family metallopeptidase [Dermatophilaceae bacterium]